MEVKTSGIHVGFYNEKKKKTIPMLCERGLLFQL